MRYRANAPPLLALARHVGAIMRTRGMTMATAESCTGGLISALVTAVPGSSEYYLGGAVTYANESKVSMLGVDPVVLAQHGAISAPAAVQMADGIRSRLGSDLAVSVTGIAGPGGGTAEKPVGLVFIGIAAASGVTVTRHHFRGSRDRVRATAATAALRAVLEAANRMG